MSAVFVGLGIAALATVAVWAFVSLIEQADAEQGPPPTRRPDPLAAEWDAHVEDALRVALGTPIYDRLRREEIEAAEGWA